MNTLLDQQLADDLLDDIDGMPEPASHARPRCTMADLDRQLEEQWQASKDASVKARQSVKARIRQAINDMAALTRQTMPYDQYATLCVAIVTMQEAHDQLEVVQ